MRFARFSIAGLLMVVFASALGFAAIRSQSDVAADATFTAFLGLLFFALLGAFGRHEPKRSFWRGFAIIGWGYAVLCFGPWFESEVQPHLVTTHALTALDEYMRPKEFSFVLTVANPQTLPVAINTIQVATPAQLANPSPAPGPVPSPAPMTPVVVSPAPQSYRLTTTTSGTFIAITTDAQRRFVRIGHSLSGLCLALGGGMLCLFWFVQRQNRDAPQAIPERTPEPRDLLNA